MIKAKEYLGDAVYVEFDGWSVVLTTEDGIRATNTVVLEPALLIELDEYLKRLVVFIAEARKAIAQKKADKVFAEAREAGEARSASLDNQGDGVSVIDDLFYNRVTRSASLDNQGDGTKG